MSRPLKFARASSQNIGSAGLPLMLMLPVSVFVGIVESLSF